MNPPAPLCLASCFVFLAPLAAPGDPPGAVPGREIGPPPELFDRLDLTRPGLDGVRDAAARRDWDAAAGALAVYCRDRKPPVYPGQETERLKWPPGPGAPARWERILRHDFDLFGMSWNPGHPVIDWDFVPPTGDREYGWALNRHTFWAHRRGPRWHPDTLAGAYLATRDETYAAEFAAQLDSWLATSPVPLETRDPDGRFRTIEAGIRLSATWPPAWHAFADSPRFTPALKCRMLKAIAEQARYLARHRSGGNWGDMEANGLVHAGVLFPEFREAEAWRREGIERLARSQRDFVYPDGAQKELTTSYHRLTLLNQTAAAQLLLANGLAAPFRDGLQRMFEATLRHMRPDGTLPMWNDSDLGDDRWVLAAGAELFAREDFRYAATGGREGRAPAETSCFFPYAGWAVLRGGWDADARYLAVDLGPYGTAHQHEDKLSIDAFAFGRPMVVDPGRYTYGPGPWRPFFRGPLAHNTVVVDGLGQNRAARGETWKTDAPLSDAAFTSTPAYDYARGVYADGFGPDNAVRVTHTRQVAFVKPDTWVIHDRLLPPDDAEHGYEALWHLAPGAKVAPVENREGEPRHVRVKAVEAVWSDARLEMQVVASAEVRVEVIEGREPPAIQGWYARAYGVKEPAPCVVVSWRARGVTTLTTALQPARGRGAPFTTAPVAEGDVAGVEILRGADRRTAILFAPSGGRHRAGAREFEGEVGVLSR